MLVLLLWGLRGQERSWQVLSRAFLERGSQDLIALFAICDYDAHRGPQKSQRFPRPEKAMLHCDVSVRWKVASDLRFRAAISEPKTPSFCGISGDLAPSTRKSLAIASLCDFGALRKKSSHHRAILWRTF